MQPVTDISSPSIICNTGFIQPVSSAVASVPAGGVVSAEFHRTSAGYIGPDPADPIDPTNKGELERPYMQNSNSPQTP